MTRLERFEKLTDGLALEDESCRQEARDAITADGADSLPAYLLVEKSTHNRNAWITVHDSMVSAATYHDGQEYPEDWSIVGLFDLDSDAEYCAQSHTTFERFERVS